MTNQGTSQLRTATTDNTGSYIVPQLPPGIYDISVKKAGFATENRANVQLQVNQNATLNFALSVSSAAETVQVTGAPPPLNTTSATLGDVVGHEATVDLPLNGREFTQLTLLTPGAAPIQDAQQSGFAVTQGAGGISPSVNGQRGEQNNFTMDGLLNNQLFTNIWAISPPPDALQEFNVQSHITDAQFAISSGSKHQYRHPLRHQRVSMAQVGSLPVTPSWMAGISLTRSAFRTAKTNMACSLVGRSFCLTSMAGTTPGLPAIGRDSDPRKL